ncbi:MAG: hypothetical protein P8Q36_07440 [Alphaproteobacteria bacterium]|nr:hypothetical protein [Alphaproteobacteria bacterium]
MLWEGIAYLNGSVGMPNWVSLPLVAALAGLVVCALHVYRERANLNAEVLKLSLILILPLTIEFLVLGLIIDEVDELGGLAMFAMFIGLMILSVGLVFAAFYAFTEIKARKRPWLDDRAL